MCSSGEDPCLCTCREIRLRSPECGRYRKLRHRLLGLLAVYAVDDQTEAVAKVDQGGRYCRAFLCRKYKTRRILTISHCQRIYLDADRAVCDRRANLKHVCLKHSFLARYEIVGVVLHEGRSLCVRSILCHDLHQTDHCCGLPVTLSAEAVALLHQSLDRQTRKLL